VAFSGDGNSGRSHLRHRRNAASNHHVARRIVHASHVVLRENLAVCLVDEDAVRGNDIGAKHSDFVQVLHWRHPVLLLAVVPFFLHLSDVNQDRRMILARQSRSIL